MEIDFGNSMGSSASTVITTFPDFDSLDEAGKKKWTNKMSSIKKKLTKIRKQKALLIEFLDSDECSENERAAWQRNLQGTQARLEEQEGLKKKMLDQKYKNTSKNKSSKDVANLKDVEEADVLPDPTDKPQEPAASDP